MEGGKKDLLELFLRLSEAKEDERPKILQDAFNTGYLTIAEFERYVHVINDRINDVRELTSTDIEGLKEWFGAEVRSAKLELDTSIDGKITATLEYVLPDAVAKVNAERRSGLFAWLKKHIGLVTQILLFLASLITFWASYQNFTTPRDLTRLEAVTDALDSVVNP
ncbi:MAG: hypothetical protein AAFO91_10290 [Bacteroidota bacterium]